MDNSKRADAKAASSYQFVLKDLKSANKHWITALTWLALEDIRYCDSIVQVIQHQFWKVDDARKLHIIYLIDSITKKVGGIYTPLLSQQLPEMMLHLMKTATIKVRDNLCKMRQTWKFVMAVEILNKIDTNVREIDLRWPYTQKDINLLDDLKAVESQIRTMQKEIRLLEKVDENKSEVESRKEINWMEELTEVKNQIEKMRKEIQLLEQQGQPGKLCSNKKRSRTEETVEENPSKKRQPTKIEMDAVDLLQSSVLLTPPPE